MAQPQETSTNKSEVTKPDMNEKYKEIMNLPHHVSENRPHMSMIDRAAQFSPFAALTGHDEALDETARLTDVFVEPDEDEKQLLDEKLRMIAELVEEKPVVTVTYFVPDDKKDGGRYVNVADYIKRIDVLNREIITGKNVRIPVDFIVGISGDIFDGIIY